jgi:hypothetical protein
VWWTSSPCSSFTSTFPPEHTQSLLSDTTIQSTSSRPITEVKRVSFFLSLLVITDGNPTLVSPSP